MNITNNGRLFATTTLLLLIATMASPAAFAQPERTAATSVGVASIVDMQAGECGNINLVFAIDDTGSMGGTLGNVQANVGPIFDQAELADIDAAEYGLITFKDDVTVIHQIGADRATVEASIGALFASGGSGEPEASNEAKNTAINNLPGGDRADVSAVVGTQTGDFTNPWTGDTNILIVITDATAAGFNDVNDAADSAQMGALGTAAAGLGILVSDIHVGSPDPSFDPIAAPPLMADAANSGGKYVFTADGTGVAQAIIDIIADCGEDKPSVSGELLPLNTTSLFISGLFANSFWMLPTMAGIVGAGAYVVKSRMHKD